MRFMLDCSPLLRKVIPIGIVAHVTNTVLNMWLSTGAHCFPLVTPPAVSGALFWDRRRPRLPVLHLRCSSCTGAGEDACGPEERAREFQGVTKRVRMRTYSWLVGFNVRFVPARDTCSHSFRCRRPSTTFVFPEWTAIIKNRIDHPPGRFHAFITGEQGVVTT